MFFSIYIWMTSDLWLYLGWLPNIIFFNKKPWINNNQVLVKNHACFYSLCEIKIQAHSKTLFNVLVTGGRLLGVEIQNPKTNLKYQIMSAQDLLHNAQEKRHKNEFFSLYINLVLHKTESCPNFSVIMNWKRKVDDNQLLVQTYTCFYSWIDITNQSHSTPSFNVLETGEHQLGMAIQKPKKI